MIYNTDSPSERISKLYVALLHFVKTYKELPSASVYEQKSLYHFYAQESNKRDKGRLSFASAQKLTEIESFLKK